MLKNYLMSNNFFNYKKKWGQHFLKDENVKNNLIDILIKIPVEKVIEIGPGNGAITKKLILNKKVTAIEIDQDCIEEIKKISVNSNLNIIKNDIMKIDFEKTFKNDEECIFFGNLPYNISSQIIFKFMIQTKIKYGLFMIQKELAQRFYAKVNDSKYNNLSVISSLFFVTNLKLKVSKNCFYPKPKVESEVIYFERKNINDNNLLEFSSFIRIAFFNRRKYLIKNLENSLYAKSSTISNIFKNLNINEKIRAQELDPETFFQIFNFLKNEKS